MNAAERERADRAAVSCLVQAAAAMTEPTPENRAFALMLAATALIHMAAADLNERALHRATEYLAALRESA
jgi:hypothetical protein